MRHNADMTTSVFDLFKIGIGPSSSHTVGPMRAAATFAHDLVSDPAASKVTRVRSELFGSLGATGHGHGSEPAVLLGLEGEDPKTVATETMRPRADEIIRTRTLRLGGSDEHAITFDADADLVLHRTKTMAYCDGKVYDSEGRLCTHATGTFKYMPRTVKPGQKQGDGQTVIATD